MRKNKKSDLQKVVDTLPFGVKDELDAMGEIDIKRKIVEASSVLVENRNLLKEDPDLQQAKDVVKNLMEPYKETQNSQQSIVDYCVFLLNEKGKL